MARIVLGLGTSHTPLLAIEPQKWNEYIVRDYTSRRLNLSDGSWLSYEELNQLRNGRYADITDVGTFVEKSDICQRALDRLGSEIAAADPDVVVIVTDDETELFDRMNTPAVSIYYGETIITRPRQPNSDPVPSFMPDLLRTYALDEPHNFPAVAGFARELIEGFIEHDIDVGAAAQIEKPLDSGFGHGIGFVETRIFGAKKIPVIPLLINTYYPPNAPRPSRCHDIGRVLRRCIEGNKQDLRVAVMASGGLSHFVVDEDLDRCVIEGFEAGRSAQLRSLPVAALNSGSSEIRNWIVVAGAIEGMERRWLEYQPLYRTPAGTGIGVAFGVWA